MDPEATIRELRQLYTAALDADTCDPHDAMRMAELVEALDSWLQAGGFLPRSWGERKEKP